MLPSWPTVYLPCTYSTWMPSCSCRTTITKSCRSSAKKKSGIEKPKYENDVAKKSNAEYCRTALTTPMSRASTTENTRAVPTNSTEFHVASPTMSATGRWVRNDSPQLPCTKSPSHERVLRRLDSSRWYSCSRLLMVWLDTPGRCRNSRNGSPRAETRAKTTMVASSTTASATTSRRPMNAITAHVSSRAPSRGHGKAPIRARLRRIRPVFDVPGEPVLRRVVLHTPRSSSCSRAGSASGTAG